MKIFPVIRAIILSVVFFIAKGFPLRVKSSFSKSRLPKLSDEDIYHYDGKISAVDLMEAGFEIDDLGVSVMVGPSLAAEGRGLFICLNDDVTETRLPSGQPLSGYAKGNLTNISSGDKTVGYAFNSVGTGVIYNQKLMPLADAIASVSETTGATDIRDLVYGHELYIVDDTPIVQIKVAEGFLDQYFVPAPITQFTIGNIGMFTNDLAYDDSSNKESYEILSEERNVLQIVWRMALIQDRLTPTWPVIILTKDCLFTNLDPMELGLEYSWSYWENWRLMHSEQQSPGQNPPSQ